MAVTWYGYAGAPDGLERAVRAVELAEQRIGKVLAEYSVETQRARLAVQTLVRPRGTGES
jgi:hypothetical protein